MDINSGCFYSSSSGESGGDSKKHSEGFAHSNSSRAGRRSAHLTPVHAMGVRAGLRSSRSLWHRRVCSRGIYNGVRTTLLPHLVRGVGARVDGAAYRELRALIKRLNPVLVQTHHSKAGIFGPGRGSHQEPTHSGAYIAHAVFWGGVPVGRLTSLSPCLALCFRASRIHAAVGPEIRDLYINSKIGHPDRYHVVRAALDVQTVHRSSTAQSPQAVAIAR